MRPTVVVLGSGEAGRTYDPPLKDQPRISEASAALGRELAAAGMNLVVFSSQPDFVEADVVRAFLGASGDDARVIVRNPRSAVVDFGADTAADQRIQIEPDSGSLWETSYYQAILEADGIVILGGGRASRIAGIIALVRNIPVVAVAGFGAGAEVVWEQMHKHQLHATAEELRLMGRPWRPDSAERLVAALVAQQTRVRDQAEAERMAAGRALRDQTRAGLAAITALLTTVLLVVFALLNNAVGVNVACLVVAPVFAAVGGAFLRESGAGEAGLTLTGARGAGAGLLAVMLYVATQQLAGGAELTTESARRLLWFVIPMGIAAGYTFDLVYAKLKNVDVMAEKPALQTPAPSKE